MLPLRLAQAGSVYKRISLVIAFAYRQVLLPRRLPSFHRTRVTLVSEYLSHLIKAPPIRKGRLFAKYSLLETARLNGQEPYRYPRYVLTEIAKGNDDDASLLPHNLDPIVATD